jgi:hypothetical protein
MEQHTNLSLTILEVFVLWLILTQEMLFKKWIMMNSVVEGHHIPQAGPKVFPTCCVSLAIV